MSTTPPPSPRADAIAQQTKAQLAAMQLHLTAQLEARDKAAEAREKSLTAQLEARDKANAEAMQRMMEAMQQMFVATQLSAGNVPAAAPVPTADATLRGQNSQHQ